MPKSKVKELLDKKFKDKLDVIDESNVVKKLMKSYIKDSEREGHYRGSTLKNGHQQCDILYMPDDNGYKYALIIVDIATRSVDAKAIKSLKSNDVIQAFKDIYKGPYLKQPIYMIQSDRGTEFTNKKIEEYFHNLGIVHKLSKTGRHRQTAIVESMNKIIGVSLFEIQHKYEIATGKQDKRWVNNLKDVIEVLNEAYQKKPEKSNITMPVVNNKDDKILLDEGTVVRVPNEYPKDVNNDKIYTKFRATDLKFDKTKRKIEGVALIGNQPPFYKIENIPNTYYTKNQLQIVDKDEKDIKIKPKETTNEKIIIKKFTAEQGNKYLVNYINSNNKEINHWRLKSILYRELGKEKYEQLVKNFESGNK